MNANRLEERNTQLEDGVIDGNWFDRFMDGLPFLAGMAGAPAPRLSGARLIESLIIAALTAVGSFALFMWQALPVIEAKLNNIEKHLERIDSRNDEQDRKLYEHEGKIRTGVRE